MFKRFLVGMSLVGLSLGAHAADFPQYPIEIVVPYAAGGVADNIARHIAKNMADELNQSVVVVNRPGGNTVIGTDLVLNSKPDGHKVLMVTNTNALLNPLIYSELPYDTDDLQVITVNFAAPLVLLANNDMPFSDVEELKAYADENPDSLNYSSASATGPLSLTVERLKRALDFDMEPIAYSGGNPALMAVMAGDVEVGIDAFSGSMSSIKAGKVKALAVTSAERLEVMPEIPAVSETIPDFVGSVWYGFAVSSETDDEIQEALRKVINTAAANPELTEMLINQGLVVYEEMSPADISEMIESETVDFAEIIEELDIKL